MLAIFRKEMKSYFTSIIGYLFIAFFIVFLSLYHYSYNISGGASNYGYALSGVAMFFVLLIPMVTMRIMAEETKQKTDQMLYTSPVSITKIVCGKYLALLALFGIVMIFACIQPLFMSKYGSVNMSAAYYAIFGFILLGATYLAIGMFISSVTESQVFAAIITFVVVLFTALIKTIVGLFPTDAKTALMVFSVCLLLIALITFVTMHNVVVSTIIFCVSEGALLVLYYMDSTVLEGSVAKVFDWLSIYGRFNNFYYGIFSFADIVYYISMAFIFVFLTIQSINKRRWN